MSDRMDLTPRLTPEQHRAAQEYQSRAASARPVIAAFAALYAALRQASQPEALHLASPPDIGLIAWDDGGQLTWTVNRDGQAVRAYTVDTAWSD